MNISAWSIRRPIPSLVLFLVLMALGLLSFRTMPITRFPNIDIPIVTIDITQSGAAPVICFVPSDFRSAEIDASQDELASMANVARVTAGLILRKFEKDGAIELAYRRIVVVDPDRLRQILVS